ncbi:TIGR02569 family protein [Corynebacterium vitaeruminis]|uniref:TIGR02569 family protein n=1 Tax=Corynebacterium vitaeruminis TaxID=38305 RepID=UPI00055825E7|nr:TIGR02569 family protein [Corynebacterium vitaeruminis]
MEFTALPDHVRDAFHASDNEAKQLGIAWDYGWRVGPMVFSQVAHHDRCAWSARVRETLKPEGLRVVRPVRSADGRFTNAGWRVNSYVAGIVTKRVDETVAAALRLDEALAEVEIPDSFYEVDESDLFSIADHWAWSDNPYERVEFDRSIPAQETSAELLEKISRLLKPIDAPVQVTHADMFGTTIYAGTQAPTVTDLVGVAHPFGYTAALTIVDALTMEATDEAIIDRFSHIPHIDQLLLRALAYRVCVHALHPEATANTGTNLNWVAGAVMSRVSVTL